MTRILVVDDWSDRVSRLRRFAGPDLILDDEGSLRTLIGEYDANDLTGYDAVLVDFDLGGHRPESAPYPEVALASDALIPTTDRVPATTGVGALLHLDRLLAARSDRPRLLAFVNANESQGRIYAAAANLWFGAEFFPSTLPPPAGDWLRDLATYVARRSEPMMLRAAAEAFETLLVSDVNGAARSLDSRPSTFEWLQVYLAAGGWHAGVQRVLDALYAVTGGRAVGRVQPRFWQDLWSRLLEAYNDFWMAFPESEPLDPPSRVRDRGGDPLLDHLVSSSLFWTAPDVRAAYERARRPASESPRE